MILIHFFLALFYLGLSILFVLYYRTYYINNQDDKFFFATGFFLKIFGATASVIIYLFYYGGGDTVEYFKAGESLLHYLLEYPSQVSDVFLSTDLKHYSANSFISFPEKNNYWYAKSTFIISKIAMILNLFSFNSFYLTSILCSFFSFFCSWKFYKFIVTNSQLNKRHVGYAIFFMPSVVFWGSGLFKDTYTLGGLYLLIIGFVNLFGYFKFKLSNLIYLLIGGYLLLSIRSFFLIAALPFILLWVLSLRYYQIPTLSFRLLLLPVFLIATAISAIVIIQSLTQFFQELSIEKLIDTSKGFQSWHTTLKGSAYSLGEIEYTTNAFISKIPASIVVTFFRPFLWEAGKPIIFLSALQSLFFLYITIYLIFKMKIIYFFKSFFRSPEAIALMGFSLFYGMVAGFTSYNFGALDRYKIPCLSTYILALIFTLDKYKTNHSNRYSTNG